MKRFYKILLMVLFIIGILSNLSLGTIYGESIFNTKTPSNELTDLLKEWIVNNEAQFYRDITVVATPVDIKIKEDSIEGIFNVTVSEILKANSPEELPMIKGMKNFG